MSADNRSLHQRIKKFSKYITAKVKETTHNILNDDPEDTRLELEHPHSIVIRRHSSYIQPPGASIIESNTMNQKKNPIILKQDFNQPHTIPNSSTPVSSALSPPPRQSKSKKKTSTNQYSPTFSSSSFTSSPCSSSSSL